MKNKNDNPLLAVVEERNQEICRMEGKVRSLRGKVGWLKLQNEKLKSELERIINLQQQFPDLPAHPVWTEPEFLGGATPAPGSITADEKSNSLWNLARSLCRKH